MTTPTNLREDIDDAVHEMRMLAGTGDVDRAALLLHRIFDVYNDATRYDREQESDDSVQCLNYVLDMTTVAIDNIRGLPISNRSRAAKEASHV